MKSVSSSKKSTLRRLPPYVVAAVMIAYSIVLMALIAADIAGTTRVVGS